MIQLYYIVLYFKAALRAPQDCIRIGNVNVKVMVGELSKVKVGYYTKKNSSNQMREYGKYLYLYINWVFCLDGRNSLQWPQRLAAEQ